MVEYLRVFRHVGFFVLGYAREGETDRVRTFLATPVPALARQLASASRTSKENHDYCLSTRLVNDEHAHRGDCVVDEHWHSDRGRAIPIGVWCSK